MPENGDVALPNDGDTCDYYVWNDRLGWVPTLNAAGRALLWSQPPTSED